MPRRTHVDGSLESSVNKRYVYSILLTEYDSSGERWALNGEANGRISILVPDSPAQRSQDVYDPDGIEIAQRGNSTLPID